MTICFSLSTYSSQVGVLLEYDSDSEEINTAPQEPLANEEREERDPTGSRIESQSVSMYRTRNHVRNINLQTPT